MSRDVVIVFVARTPIGRAYRGAFNATPGPTLAAHAIRAAVAPAKVVEAFRSQDGRYRTLGIERSLRGASSLLPRQTGHSQGCFQRRRWRHLHWASLRHVRESAGSPRVDRRLQAEFDLLS